MRCWPPSFRNRLAKKFAGHQSLELPYAQLTLTHQPFLPIHRAFNSVLRRISLEREQTNNRITASTGAIDPRIREELHRLAYAEFMF